MSEQRTLLERLRISMCFDVPDPSIIDGLLAEVAALEQRVAGLELVASCIEGPKCGTCRNCIVEQRNALEQDCARLREQLASRTAADEALVARIDAWRQAWLLAQRGDVTFNAVIVQADALVRDLRARLAPEGGKG